MTIDSTRETWAKIRANQCPSCDGALSMQTDNARDRERGQLAVVGCEACAKRFAVYLDSTGHGVEELPA